MKRTVSRKQALPAFELDLGQLEVLVDRVVALFPRAEFFLVRITIELPNQEYQFESVAEVRQCVELPPRVDHFSVWASEGARRVSVNKYGVSVEGETPAWCAGAVETVLDFVQNHRRWYSRLRGWPITVSYFAVFTGPTILQLAPLNGIARLTSLAAWLACAVVVSLIFFRQQSILPPMSLKVVPEESRIRRYMPEVTLLVSLLALALTILGWFVGG